jgi:ketosteroid isomerase-like protein
MTTDEIARDFVALCKDGKFQDAGETYWADDVVSYEAMGDMREAKGIGEVRGKGAWWNGKHEINTLEVGGPYVHGDTFAVRFVMTFTDRDSGERASMDELGFYRVRDGKIVEERFFFGT